MSDMMRRSRGMRVVLMAKKAEKKEKPTPKKCVCGLEAVIVKNRSKKVVSCPDPLNCRGNLRTMWESGEESAINKWNKIGRAHV